jgi:hypothetical protein
MATRKEEGCFKKKYQKVADPDLHKISLLDPDPNACQLVPKAKIY